MNLYKKILIATLAGFAVTTTIVVPTILLVQPSIPHINYNDLKKQYEGWYSSLTNNSWNKDNDGNYINYHANSEQQAIALYSWCSGTFWNVPLHNSEEPKNHNAIIVEFDKETPREINGDGYKHISTGLQKAIVPYDLTVYHGVEFMEIEFYNQLKDFIVYDENKKDYDYSNCVDKTITSNGFISTSLVESYADNFFDWKPRPEVWPNEGIVPNPLKEPVLFEIKIPKGYKGAAYLSNFDFAGFGTGSTEHQVLIDRNCKFKITNVKQNVLNSALKPINIFEVELLMN